MIFGDIAKAIRATASALEWWCRTARMREIRQTRKIIKDLEDELNKIEHTPDGANDTLRVLNEIKQEKQHLKYLSSTDD